MFPSLCCSSTVGRSTVLCSNSSTVLPPSFSTTTTAQFENHRREHLTTRTTRQSLPIQVLKWWICLFVLLWWDYIYLKYGPSYLVEWFLQWLSVLGKYEYRSLWFLKPSLAKRPAGALQRGGRNGLLSSPLLSSPLFSPLLQLRERERIVSVFTAGSQEEEEGLSTLLPKLSWKKKKKNWNPPLAPFPSFPPPSSLSDRPKSCYTVHAVLCFAMLSTVQYIYVWSSSWTKLFPSVQLDSIFHKRIFLICEIINLWLIQYWTNYLLYWILD